MGASFVNQTEMLGGDTEAKLRWIIVRRGGGDLLKVHARLRVIVKIEIARGEVTAGQSVARVLRQHLLEENGGCLQMARGHRFNRSFVEVKLRQTVFRIGSGVCQLAARSRRKIAERSEKLFSLRRGGGGSGRRLRLPSQQLGELCAKSACLRRIGCGDVVVLRRIVFEVVESPGAAPGCI